MIDRKKEEKKPTSHHEADAPEVLAALGAREALHMVLLGCAGGSDDTILDELFARVAPRAKVQAVVGLKQQQQKKKWSLSNEDGRKVKREKLIHLAIRPAFVKEELFFQGAATM